MAKRKSDDRQGDALEQAYAGVRKLERRKRRAPDAGPEAVPVPRIEAEAMQFRVQMDENGRVTALREDTSDKVLRELRGGRFEPQATLDLHGMLSGEAVSAVRAFVRDARARGFARILVIHGKGLHSEGGLGVLGDCVVQALTGQETSRMVRAFHTADGRHGGSGAIAVALASR